MQFCDVAVAMTSVGSDCGRDPRAVLGVERVVDNGPVSKKTIHFKGSPFLLQIMFNDNQFHDGCKFDSS